MSRRSAQRPDTGNFGAETGMGVLLLAGLPLILWVFEGTVFSMVLAVFMFGTLAFSLKLILRGQEVERAYNAARVARRPRMPRKIMGSVLIAGVVLVLAGHQFDSILIPFGFAGLALASGIVAFGLDPLKDKGLDDPAELARIRKEAFRTELETVLAETSARIHGLGDADLSQRTDAGIDNALCLLRAMEDDEIDSGKLTKTLSKFTEILGAEVLRLEEDWEGERYIFARRRYLAKLTVLLQSLEQIAWKDGIRAGKDAFDIEADLLLARMQGSSAA